jgi:putative flippase GtrA
MGMRLVRFVGVGLLATATDFLVFNLTILGTTDPPAIRILEANTLAFACATAVGYVMNARVTFRATRDRGSLARYVAVVLVGAAIYNGALALAVHTIDPGNRYLLNLVKLGAVLFSATWNFCGFSLFAFSEDRAQQLAAEPREARL